jgi:hypothetical protein
LEPLSTANLLKQNQNELEVFFFKIHECGLIDCIFSIPMPSFCCWYFPFSLMLFSRKLEWGLYFLCVLIPLQYFVTPYYLGFVSQHFVWLDELVVFAMFSLVVFNKIVRKEPCNLSYIDAWVGFFVVFSIVFSLIISKSFCCFVGFTIILAVLFAILCCFRIPKLT